jgi:NAD(P)-dependent dehydrogenase (short-subunit alcohol dehydrogenase family)
VTSTVFITGAARGLGFHLARTFHERGWAVLAGYRESTPAFDSLIHDAKSVQPVKLDVTDAKQVKAAANEVSRKVSALDVLINNAAILPSEGRGTIETTNIEVGLRVFDVNSLGPLRVTQALLPLLRAGERRLILNVSSEAGSCGGCWRKDEFLYCMSKAALNVQTTILKNDLSRFGFRVLAVHPGWLRTEMGGSEADLDPTESALALVQLATRTPPEGEPTYLDYTGKALEW